MHPIDLTQYAFYSIANDGFPSRTADRKAYLYRNVHPYLLPRNHSVDQPDAAHRHRFNTLCCAAKERSDQVLPLQAVRCRKATGAGGIIMSGLLLPGLHGLSSGSLTAATVSDRKPFAPLCTATRQHSAAVLRCHTRAESMRVGALPPARLIRTFAHQALYL